MYLQRVIHLMYFSCLFYNDTEYPLEILGSLCSSGMGSDSAIHLRDSSAERGEPSNRDKKELV